MTGGGGNHPDHTFLDLGGDSYLFEHLEAVSALRWLIAQLP
jgi:hypothetical protein